MSKWIHSYSNGWVFTTGRRVKHHTASRWKLPGNHTFGGLQHNVAVEKERKERYLRDVEEYKRKINEPKPRGDLTADEVYYLRLSQFQANSERNYRESDANIATHEERLAHAFTLTPPPVPAMPPLKIIKKTWEDPVTTGRDYTIGFVDFSVEFAWPWLDLKTKEG